MSEIRATTVSDIAGTGPVALTGQYAAKAWINFNGSGTVAIRQSGNVSSITDNGTGIYGLNFSTALQDADYAVSGTAGPGTANQTQYAVEIDNLGLNASTANINVGITSSGSSSGSDASIVTAMIIR